MEDKQATETPPTNTNDTPTTTTATTSIATKKTSTKQKQDKDGKVLVQFVTKNPELRVPETPIAVPIKLGRFGLSEVINLLLNKSPPKPFDFLIDSEFIRTSIEKHLKKHELKEELVVIEYTEAVVPPERELECEHDDWVSCLAGGFSGFIVTGSYIWNQTTGECLATVNAHDSAIKSCAWIAKAAVPKKGKMTYKIVTAGLDREVKTWRISESGHRLKHVYKGHVGTVNSVQVSPTGKKICSGSFDHTVKLWDVKPDSDYYAEKHVAKRRKLEEPTSEIIDCVTLVGHTASVSCVRWPTLTQLISASWDHTLRIWDAESTLVQNTLVAPTVVHSLSYSPLFSLIVSAQADSTIRVWDPRVDGKIAQQMLTSHQNWVTDVSWHPLSPHAQFASSSQDNTVKVWDLRSPLPLFTLTSHNERVLCVDWAGVAENGSTTPTRFDLASGGADNKLRVFKCDSLQPPSA